MSGKPAGLSDSGDEENFSFFNEKNGAPQNRNGKKKICPKKETPINGYKQNEQRDIEYQAINACTVGDLDGVVEYLNAHNVNNFLHSGWTLLLYAASFVHEHIIEYLLTHSADPNIHGDGYTPLMALCSSTKGTTEKYFNSLRLLIDAKANVDAADNQGTTPLMYACQTNKLECVTILLDHVKNINASDIDGCTALIHAVLRNNIDIVNILLINQADVTITDRNQLTAIDVAQMKGYEKILALLNPHQDNVLIDCEISTVKEWRDLFPQLSPSYSHVLNHDIATILYGMGLERYNNSFKGMELDTFLQLTEEDLVLVGMDISVHRKQFVENLYKFHNKKWNVKSLGSVKKSLPYTIYDAVVSLGTITKQIHVIRSSFQYIARSIECADKKNVHLSTKERFEYEQELKTTKATLSCLTREVVLMKILANQISKENTYDPPAIFIDSKKKKISWILVTSVIVVTGIFLSKSVHFQRLWNN